MPQTDLPALARLRSLCDSATPDIRLERGNLGKLHPLFAVPEGRDGLLLWTDADTELFVKSKRALPVLIDTLEALMPYLRHMKECEKRGCTCGLDAILARLAEGLEER